MSEYCLKNYGLQIANPQAGNWVFDEDTGISALDILQWDGHGWEKYLPKIEYQRLYGLETMACVTFSALNCLETLAFRKYNEIWNKSDRFTAKISGTTSRGNYLLKVADSIKDSGIVDEALYPWLQEMDWDEYYKQLSGTTLKWGVEWLKEWEVQYEWVSPFISNFKKALQFAPLQTVVHAWEKPVDGIYKRTDKITNHAVMIYDYVDGEYWMIYDHYDNTKKKLAWDFIFGYSMKYNLIKKSDNIMSNVKLVKDLKSPAVGFFVPATDEAGLKTLANNYGKELPLDGDKVDWTKINYEGTVTIK